MNPTAGSFVIDPRLQRLFATFAVETPSMDSLMTIFGTFMHGHLKKFNSGGSGGGACVLVDRQCSAVAALSSSSESHLIAAS